MRKRGEREGGVREGKRGERGRNGEGIKSSLYTYLHRYTHTKNVCTCIRYL